MCDKLIGLNLFLAYVGFRPWFRSACVYVCVCSCLAFGPTDAAVGRENKEPGDFMHAITIHETRQRGTNSFSWRTLIEYREITETM